MTYLHPIKPTVVFTMLTVIHWNIDSCSLHCIACVMCVVSWCF